MKNAYSRNITSQAEACRRKRDACFVNQQLEQNKDFSDYNLTNFRNPEELERVGMTRWGGYEAPASIIDHDNELRRNVIVTDSYKTSNIRTDCYDFNAERTGTCSNFGNPSGSSSVNYNNESYQKCRFQDQLSNNCFTNFNQVSETNPNKYIPMMQIEPWVRGGIITSHNLRNPDEQNKIGKIKELRVCNRPYLG